MTIVFTKFGIDPHYAVVEAHFPDFVECFDIFEVAANREGAAALIVHDDLSPRAAIAAVLCMPSGIELFALEKGELIKLSTDRCR